ncbi:unnamed protein product, partial [Discosporangium mesarthrocarpum]
VLTIVIALHEAGHFVAARSQGIRYTLRAIPVGGFVSFPNNWEADKEGNVTEFDDPDLLQNR